MRIGGGGVRVWLYQEVVLFKWRVNHGSPEEYPEPEWNEQALVSLKLKKSVDAEGGRTFAVIIEDG